MRVPASVAMTVWYISRARMERVEGRRTGGMVRVGWVFVYFDDVDRAVAIAFEVSRTMPAMAGRARVRAERVFGMGRL